MKLKIIYDFDFSKQNIDLNKIENLLIKFNYKKVNHTKNSNIYNKDEFCIVVPTRSDLNDYERAIANILNNLSTFEDLSIIKILNLLDINLNISELNIYDITCI